MEKVVVVLIYHFIYFKHLFLTKDVFFNAVKICIYLFLFMMIKFLNTK